MSVDVFSRTAALKLLHNRQLMFFGDSNTRSIYKDFVWLLEYGNLVPQDSLKTKNELTHANDYKTSNSPLTSGRNYEETREYYNTGTCVKFTFLTKMFSESLTRAFEDQSLVPDVVVINSCVWDLSRWGPNGVAEFKKNVVHTMEYFKKRLSKKCLVVFTTTLPLSSNCRGGFLMKQVEFLRYPLPYHVIEANNYLAEMARLYNYDVLDLHYNMRFLREEWMPDGIHWTPLAYRLITNFLLTHLALSFNAPLPGLHGLDERFILNSQFVKENNDNGGKKRKEVDVIDSNETKKLRVFNQYNTKPSIVSDQCNNNTVETKAATVVSTVKQLNETVDTQQQQKSTAESEQLNVAVVETSNQADCEINNNQLMLSASNCDNKIVVNEANLPKLQFDANLIAVETKQQIIETEITDVEIVSNKVDTVRTNETIENIFQNQFIETKLLNSCNSVTKDKCFNEPIKTKQLKVDAQFYDIKIVDNNEPFSTYDNVNNELIETKPFEVDGALNNAQIETIENLICVDSTQTECFNEPIEIKQFTFDLKSKINSIEIKESIVGNGIIETTEQLATDLNQLDSDEHVEVNEKIEIIDLTEAKSHIELIEMKQLNVDTSTKTEHSNSVETKAAIDEIDSTVSKNEIFITHESNEVNRSTNVTMTQLESENSKEEFYFAFFIETFSPQLESLK